MIITLLFYDLLFILKVRSLKSSQLKQIVSDIFNLTRYDIDNSGAIDKQEMLKVMKAIYAMVSVCECLIDIFIHYIIWWEKFV